MRTLRELGEFVGIPQDSGEFGSPIPPIGLRLVSNLLAPVSTAQQRSSMRAMIGLHKAVQVLQHDRDAGRAATGSAAANTAEHLGGAQRADQRSKVHGDRDQIPPESAVDKSGDYCACG
jgi:hypothetical protein